MGLPAYAFWQALRIKTMNYRIIFHTTGKVLLAEAEEDPLPREGSRGVAWVPLDYGCIAVHVFNAEAREFYGLERLWRDGTPVDLTGVVDAKE